MKEKCPARRRDGTRYWYCARERNHPGDHLALRGDVILARWPKLTPSGQPRRGILLRED